MRLCGGAACHPLQHDGYSVRGVSSADERLVKALGNADVTVLQQAPQTPPESPIAEPEDDTESELTKLRTLMAART